MKRRRRQRPAMLLTDVTPQLAAALELHVYTGTYYEVPVAGGVEIISAFEAGPIFGDKPDASLFVELVHEPILKDSWPCPRVYGSLGCLVQRAEPFARTPWLKGATEEVVTNKLKEKYGLAVE